MNKTALYFFIIALLLNGCTSSQNSTTSVDNNLFGSWRLNDSAKRNESAAKVFKNDSENEEKNTNGIIISFFKDNSFTYIKNNGELIFGKWMYDAENNSGIFPDSELKDIFILQQDTTSSGFILSLVNGNKLSKKIFYHSATPLKDEKADPFHFSKNQWRIKPVNKESKEQLLERIKNYFEHLVCIMEASEEREENVLSFEFSMGIVKIYQNAIGIIPKEKLPESWTNIFYDADDANTSYKMFESYLKTYTYRGKRLKGWVATDAEILKSMIYDIDHGKFIQ